MMCGLINGHPRVKLRGCDCVFISTCENFCFVVGVD
jgi:hypothetical protein